MNAHSLHLYYVACVVLIKNRIKIEKKNILRRRLHLFFVAVLYLLFPILLFPASTIFIYNEKSCHHVYCRVIYI